MKTKILILFSAVGGILLSGCEIIFGNPYYDTHYPEVHRVVPQFSTSEEYHAWIEENITYEEELGNADYWKTPEETIQSMRGDCEDVAILLMYLLKEDLNWRTALVVQESHAAVYSWEPYQDSKYYWLNSYQEILYLLSYTDVMERIN